ncbi:DUF1566 domain-containing protein [bacterium]|nr:DUF1566 domain-containing protein [bacterium]
MTITRVLVAAAALLLAAGRAGAVSDAEKCQSSELKTSGKYSFCRLKAEAKAVKTATTPDYGKCDDSFAAKFNQADTNGMGQCPAGATQAQIQAFLTQCSDDVATALAGGPLPDCSGDLATCNASLGTCNGSLGTSNTNLATCNTTLTATTASLTTCNGNLSTCTGDLGTCNTNLGTCNASLTSCSSSLTTVNAGTAAQGDVLSGKTFSSGAGIGLTGSMANIGQQNVTPGTAPVAISQGYHDGTGTVAGDTDLVAGNIKSGVDIFGVTGTVLPSQPLRTGQTQCDQGGGTLGACPGSPSGQDGTTLKGQTRSYTVNANGTITDNRTGLVWEKLDDNNANGIHDFSATFTWYNAFKKIQVLNGNVAGCIALNNPDACCSGAGTGSCTAFAGQTDWRLPNSFELFTLADHGRVSPAIDPTFNTSCAAACTTATCSCTQSDLYWSSTTYQSNPAYAWDVGFNDGGVSATNKSGTFYGRAVRGGS